MEALGDFVQLINSMKPKGRSYTFRSVVVQFMRIGESSADFLVGLKEAARYCDLGFLKIIADQKVYPIWLRFIAGIQNPNTIWKC